MDTKITIVCVVKFNDNNDYFWFNFLCIPLIIDNFKLSECNELILIVPFKNLERTYEIKNIWRKYINIIIYNEDDLYKFSPHIDGYTKQMMLKILVSKIIDTTHYLIIDPDCLMINKLSLNNLYYDNKVIIGFNLPNHYYHYFWLQNCMELLNFDKKKLENIEDTQIMGITPQIFYTHICKEILDFLEKKFTINFVEKIYEEGEKKRDRNTLKYYHYFTEYTIYWSFIINNDYQNKLYHMNTIDTLYKKEYDGFGWSNNYEKNEEILGILNENNFQKDMECINILINNNDDKFIIIPSNTVKYEKNLFFIYKIFSRHISHKFENLYLKYICPYIDDGDINDEQLINIIKNINEFEYFYVKYILFNKILEREPNYDELQYHVNRIKNKNISFFSLYKEFMNCNEFKVKYKSQHFEDKIICNLFNFNSGFFVDIGAYDGVTFSNSYILEKNLGWKGICIEPSSKSFDILKKKRESINLQCCVSNINDNEVNFIEYNDDNSTSENNISQWSTLLINDEHINKNRIIGHKNYQKKNIKIQSYTFNYIMEKYCINNIDFLSIDTEGNELNIISNIDFKKYNIKTIIYENSLDEDYNQKINSVLENNNFIFKENIINNSLFIKKPKTAIIISGFMRTYNEVFDNLKKYVINNFYEPDIFIYTYNIEGLQIKKNGEIFFDETKKINESDIINLYKPVNIKFNSFNNIHNKLYLDIPDDDLMIVSGSSAPDKLLNQIYGWYCVNEMKKEYEKQNNFVYDVVLKIRPDIDFLSKINNDEIMKCMYDKKIIYIPGYPNANHGHPTCTDCLKYYHSGIHNKEICDIFVMTNSKNMDHYCNLYTTYKDIYYEGYNYLGNKIKKHTNWKYMIKKDKYWLVDPGVVAENICCFYPERLLIYHLQNYLLSPMDIHCKLKR
jgi:FkbM family methyltransferase